MPRHPGDSHANPLINATNTLKRKRERDPHDASLPTGTINAREASQASSGLFVEQENEAAVDSGSGETSRPTVKRPRKANLQASVEEVPEDEARKTTAPALNAHVERLSPAVERASTETLKETSARRSGEGDSARSSPSSEDQDEIELVAFVVHLTQTKLSCSYDKVGTTVRNGAIKYCRDLEKVFKTRKGKALKKLYLAIRGARTNLQSSDTLRKLRTNLTLELEPLLAEALAKATEQFKTYKDFCKDGIQDDVDEKEFKRTLLERSAARVRDVKKAKLFFTNLIADLSEQRPTLLGQKISAQASGAVHINLD